MKFRWDVIWAGAKTQIREVSFCRFDISDADKVEVGQLGPYGMHFTVLTVTLNPAVDKMVKVKRLSAGRDHRVTSVFRSAGGKGINVARALTHLGIPTCATGILGGPAGSFIQDMLAQERIQADFLKLSGETRTSLTVLDQSTGRPTRILEPGPNLSRRKQAEFLRQFSDLTKKVRYVILSGRNAHGAPDNFYARLIRLAIDRKRRVILDTSGPAFTKGIAAMPFIIKPNRDEAEAFFNQRLSTLGQLKQALCHFLKLGIRMPIVSLGANGAVASNGRQFLHARAPRIKVCNPVGCGDALVAGFVFGLIKGFPFSRVLQIAVAAGTVNALSDQPGLLKHKQLRRLTVDIPVQLF